MLYTTHGYRVNRRICSTSKVTPKPIPKTSITPHRWLANRSRMNFHSIIALIQSGASSMIVKATTETLTRTALRSSPSVQANLLTSTHSRLNDVALGSLSGGLLLSNFHAREILELLNHVPGLYIVLQSLSKPIDERQALTSIWIRSSAYSWISKPTCRIAIFPLKQLTVSSPLRKRHENRAQADSRSSILSEFILTCILKDTSLTIKLCMFHKLY
ncbi:uncharacterized protein F5147DRAFT_708729 [Suillus discolor]|uniref:Uncharacterized protein n=1 Tax=Suillus discolor TaxID=1912936 RepID=A0A9P7F0J1_9AGAM|nr:uncharacterized protein F5147DRAFT_708729 [Suillus discolor]KAG2101592.1 hypothetical protein F5147DRAFT_708729 [Suillus discolor]